MKALAEEKGHTPAQLALAWLLAQGDDVVPIPGTRHVSRLEENAAAADLELTGEELERLESIIPPDRVAGTRYPEASMATVDG